MSKKISFMNKSKTMNLSEGNIFTQLMIFSLPLFLGNLFQTLYNSVDSIVIGNFESSEALAAVSASSTVALIVSGFFVGMSAGASAIFSRFFGANDYKSLHDSIHTTMLFSVALGVLLSGLGIIFSPALLSLTSCPENIYNLALIYLRIYLIGVLFTSVYNIGAAVLRSVGDSQSPFIFLVISSVLNIILDLLLVVAIPMGVTGVALATVISQAVSMVLVFWKMTKQDERYRFRFSHLKVDWKLLGEVMRLGLPAGIQSSLTAISNLYAQHYINSFSSVAIAGIGSSMRIDQFVCMPINALGLSMTTFIGQNMGAGKPERTHKSVGISLIVMLVFVAAVCTPIYFFAPSLAGLFSPDPEVIQYCVGMLHVTMPLYAFMGTNFLFGGILRGYKYSMTALICSVVGMVGMRQLWLAVSLGNFGHNIQYVYYGFPIGWFCCSVPMIIIYLFVIRKKYPGTPAAQQSGM